MTSLRCFALAFSLTLLAGCGQDNTRPTPPSPAATPTPAPQPVKVRIGLALGGGAAKGFAHIGVIKMLEANGFKPEVVSGTSAGSVVGALYASGMDAFQMQQHAVALDEASIRDLSLFSGGVLKGQALQDYVNRTIGQRAFDKMKKPFAAVATQLATGERTIFVRGNVGQAVRASCSVPGVFEPVKIGEALYVDGGLVSPVPVDAARQLGAEFVIAVDISTRVTGKTPENMLGVVNQTITIMGQKLGEQELARATSSSAEGQRHRSGRFRTARSRDPGRRESRTGRAAADPHQARTDAPGARGCAGREAESCAGTPRKMRRAWVHRRFTRERTAVRACGQAPAKALTAAVKAGDGNEQKA